MDDAGQFYASVAGFYRETPRILNREVTQDICCLAAQPLNKPEAVEKTSGQNNSSTFWRGLFVFYLVRNRTKKAKRNVYHVTATDLEC